MIRKLLPLVLTLFAFLTGAVAGEMLHPGARVPLAAEGSGDSEPSASRDTAGDGEQEAPVQTAALRGEPPTSAAVAENRGEAVPPAVPKAASSGQAAAAAPAWFRFPQQFFVPILHDGQLDSTMVLALSVEMPETASETVFAHELKLRDALLRRLLIHANTGGFDGNFTAEAHLRTLRAALTETAQEIVPQITAVLIGDIARQDRR